MQPLVLHDDLARSRRPRTWHLRPAAGTGAVALPASRVHHRGPASDRGSPQRALRGQAMTTTDLLAQSAGTQAALVRAGEISARELVQAALDEIERRDPEINAFATVCGERALAEAQLGCPCDPRPFGRGPD